MILYSYSVATKKQVTSGLTTGPVNTFIFLGNLCLVYVLIFLSINGINDEKKFFKSIVVTFIVFFILVLFPQIMASFSSVTDRWANLIGKLFESHYAGRAFYDKGSYVTTMRRVNGLDPEASFLAAKVGIIFVPPVLAAIKNNYNILTDKVNDRMAWFWLLLLAMCMTLFFAKTTTGMVVIILVLLSLFIVVPKDKRILLWTGYIVAGALMIGLYFTSHSVRNILNHYLFKKTGTDNRLGGTIALLRTFLHYPIFGVGFGYTSYYNFLYVPKWSTHNNEYLYVFLKSRAGYPDLSVWGSMLASYGLIGVVPVLVYIKNKIKKALELKSRLKISSNNDSIFLLTVIDSFYFYLAFFAILAIVFFPIHDEVYILMLMFYVHVIGTGLKRKKNGVE
jgi:hypothetical protein